jgi:hypothetical protein
MASPIARLFSGIDSVKRQAFDAFNNPLDYLSMIAGRAQEDTQKTIYLQNQALGDLKNPLRVTDQQAFDQLTDALTAQGAGAGVTKFTNIKAPSIGELPGFNMGIGGIVKPKPIAPDKQLYRETDVSGVSDLLWRDLQFEPSRLFVTDNIDLAIGQGSNKGVLVIFRPNALSGNINKKPGTTELSGFEYVTDIVAPRAVESVVFKNPKTLKQLNLKAARTLKTEFTKIENPDKTVTFVRKPEFLGQETKEEIVDILNKNPFPDTTR